MKRAFGIAMTMVIAFQSEIGMSYECTLEPPPTVEAYERGTGFFTVTFDPPRNPNVCRLYWENLKYFAERNISVDCKRSVAPHLADRIREVEWEALDPEKMRGFLDEMAGSLFGSDDDPVELSIMFIRKGDLLLRKMKIYPIAIRAGIEGKERGELIHYAISPYSKMKNRQCEVEYATNGNEFFRYFGGKDVRIIKYLYNNFTTSQMFWIDGDLYLEGIMTKDGENGESFKKVVLQEFLTNRLRNGVLSQTANPVCMYNLGSVR